MGDSCVDEKRERDALMELILGMGVEKRGVWVVMGVFFTPMSTPGEGGGGVDVAGGVVVVWLSGPGFTFVGESASVPTLAESGVLLLPLRTVESRNEENRETEELGDETRGEGGRRASKKDSIVLKGLVRRRSPSKIIHHARTRPCHVFFRGGSVDCRRREKEEQRGRAIKFRDPYIKRRLLTQRHYALGRRIYRNVQGRSVYLRV